jgi:hypothetical protein
MPYTGKKEKIGEDWNVLYSVSSVNTIQVLKKR